MKDSIPVVIVLSLTLSLSSLSCSLKENEQEAQSTPANHETGSERLKDSADSKKSVTVSGAVQSIENGKDGYVAQIRTDNDGLYSALVSIVNLGGPENFKRFEVGDKVVLSGKSYTLGSDKQLKVDKIISVENTRTALMISATSFRGITVGDKITGHSKYTQKEVMRTGEGDFEIYTIKDFNNNPAGYFLPDPNNESLVGDITVQTQMAETAEGVTVGSSFQSLKAKVVGLEVHGSEVEGRTYASYKTLSYRLDVANFTYNVDVAKIPADTRIMEIVIHRGK